MRKIRLEISGPKGNAFYILGLVNRLGKDVGLSESECEDIRAEMTGKVFADLGGGATDYNHLVRTFSKHFPYVEIYSFKELPMDSDLYVIDDGGDVEL